MTDAQRNLAAVSAILIAFALPALILSKVVSAYQLCGYVP